MTTIQPQTEAGIRQALEHVAIAQSLGQVACWIDLDRRLDIAEARRCGVNIAGLLVSQPDGLVQAQEIAAHLEKTGVVAVIVVAGS
jgi:recombination protein RecA